MTLVQKLALLTCAAPFSLALASGPAICIKPELLYQAASTGVIHNVMADWRNHDLQANRWYSVGEGGYAETMPLLLDKSHHWELAAGYQDTKGVYCSYLDKNTNSTADLQLFFKVPSDPLKKK
jgi:hypothetical protein